MSQHVAPGDTRPAPAVAPSLTFETVVELLSVLDGSTLPTTIDFRDGPLRLKVSRGGPAVVAAPGPAVVAPPAPVVAEATSTVPVAAPVAEQAPADQSGPGEPVTAPIAGVFYVAPNPGADPFVVAGQHVTADDVIGIVEVMKMMNTVRAGVAGTVVEVCVGDAELVGFGQALVRIQPEG
ncbi:MAG: acetyl-CoA carboxylase biotin carboxyl carrier protein [Actinomycetales bacterium]|nr:MAG: acetyl-CoA carboxylase biotin carboxyl carrier protein [Actinomycetales bacterium]